MQGYEGIQNKLYEKEVERMKQYAKNEIKRNQDNELLK